MGHPKLGGAGPARKGEVGGVGLLRQGQEGWAVVCVLCAIALCERPRTGESIQTSGFDVAGFLIESGEGVELCLSV